MSAGASGGDVIADVVALRYGSRGRVAHLRELRGADEDLLAASSGGTLAALALLNRLLVADGEGNERPAAEDLTIPDRDRVLAAVHRRAFGARVSSTVRCVACESPFDLEFSLLAFETALDREARSAARPLRADGTMTLDDGRRFRLPTGRDEIKEIAVEAPLAATRLLEACALDGLQAGDLETVPALMRACAPLLDSDLDGKCPECEKPQAIHFDLQTYLLAALAGESHRLVSDVHRIATSYGWSRTEILTMTRAQRRAHVSLIEQENRPRRRVRS